MHTLYYSPGACSMAAHILLHELSIPHRLVRTFTGDEEHRRPEYLAVNPVGKLPTLVRDDGSRLTEVSAILGYLAQIGDSNELRPSEPWAAAQLDAAIAFIASEVHPAYSLVIRPDRVLPGASRSTLDEARAQGRKRFIVALQHLEDRFVGPYLLGDTFSLGDPYVFVMAVWAQYVQVELGEFPKLGTMLAQMAARPSVVAMLRAERLVDEDGRPTPPSRV